MQKGIGFRKSVGTGSATKPNPGPLKTPVPRNRKKHPARSKTSIGAIPGKSEQTSYRVCEQTDEKNVPRHPRQRARKLNLRRREAPNFQKGRRMRRCNRRRQLTRATRLHLRVTRMGTASRRNRPHMARSMPKIDSTKTSGVHVPNLSPGGPQTSKGLLRQIEELLEKDRELSE